MMTDSQIQQLIDQKIAAAQKSSLYSTKNASAETHNGIDAPRIKYSDLIGAPTGLSTINGRSHGPTTTTIPINQASTPQLLDFATNDFANGITWSSSKFTCVTAGVYLITCTVDYLAADMQDGVAYSAIIKKNSTIVSQSDASVGGVSNPVAVTTTDLVNLAVGDTISYFCQTQSNSAMTIGSSSSGAIALV